jgi:hypothetical protein
MKTNFSALFAKIEPGSTLESLVANANKNRYSLVEALNNAWVNIDQIINVGLEYCQAILQLPVVFTEHKPVGNVNFRWKCWLMKNFSRYVVSIGNTVGVFNTEIVMSLHTIAMAYHYKSEMIMKMVNTAETAEKADLMRKDAWK